MRTLRQLRVGFVACAAALVAACAGNGGFAAAPSPLQAAPPARHGAGASWMAERLGPHNLLYVSNATDSLTSIVTGSAISSEC